MDSAIAQKDEIVNSIKRMSDMNLDGFDIKEKTAIKLFQKSELQEDFFKKSKACILNPNEKLSGPTVNFF